ncbi:EAL domain-containing protein [Clostridium perfringens]|uniref:EAL domain-containing protein n=1 Tax=Clostridium perfringens TaxID=1502 RepID=UPI0024BD0BD9|nr:EAL domain-containing protein [Clostridium perfringens]
MNEDLKLQIHYQPKVDLKSNEVYGVEALARFKNCRDEILNTEEVLKNFKSEKDNFSFSTLVIKNVFKDFKNNKIFKKGFNISVNISSIEIESFKFKDWIKTNILYNPDIINNFEFELTEKFKIQNEDIFSNRIEYLRKNGIKLSLDDLGKGFNCPQLLYKYKFDSVKLDKSFISFASENLSVSKDLINEIKKLNLKVLIEGIETQYELDIVKSLKCDFAQGFFFGKPCCLKDFLLEYENIKL